MQNRIQIVKNILFVIVIFYPYLIFYLLPESFIFHIRHSQSIEDIQECANCSPPIFCSGHIQSKYAQRLLNAYDVKGIDTHVDR